jgi:hypothetical protein
MLTAVRLLTVIVATLYSLELTPWDSIAMFFNRGLGIIGETAHSWLLTLGRVGVLISALCSLVIVFAGVPRWRHGVQLLRICFLVMGVSLLAGLQWVYIDRYIGWYNEVPTAIHHLLHSLPPFLLAIMLRQRAVIQQLQRT